MFSKCIIYLLKYFDICGFHTETKIGGKTEFYTFLMHILLACFLTASIILYTMQPVFYESKTISLVNNTVQFSSAVITYWMIIFESYIQRKKQRQFWTIYKRISERNLNHRSPNLRIYLFKFCEFSIIFSCIQLILMKYFMAYRGHFFYFMFTYFVMVKMYQNRIFYYLFYVEIIKCELQHIQYDLKRIVAHSKQNRIKWKMQRFEKIRNYFQSVYQMVQCINQVFGWSQFVTILFCLHLPLTDLNWAYVRLLERTTGYKIGARIHSAVTC